MYGIIYKAVSPTGKVYIGQTTQTLEKRKSGHINASINSTRRTHFHNAIKKYGAENIVWEQIDTAETAEELSAKEQYWIIYYKADDPQFGYNLQGGGIHYKASEETKRKMGETRKGEKNPMFGRHLTPWNKDLQGAQTHSEETRRRISEANRNPSAEIRSKLSEAGKGRTPSPEARRKISDAHKGQIPWNKGKSGCYSPEARKKISEGNQCEKSGNVTITETIARQIKTDLQAGMKNRNIARKYNVNITLVEHIKYGHSWAWLQILA